MPHHKRTAAELCPVHERIDRERADTTARYAAGDALGYLAQQYDVNPHRMKRFLRDWGVPLRTRAGATRKHP
ncbi:hypothetical protein M1P56_21265 [Streptomyces sp. HU2014]|uniref:hypothetical protein n=1 Tax=Streptomyces sp. HU2014 TaxID=2939414 RepID=UPI00200CB874|nr:hypothetical protein [Streptomyces sp. HU2014]UQI46698.1 hypothetical protein M1P56_21265 [Streptomyces sp. HU2014]